MRSLLTCELNNVKLWAIICRKKIHYAFNLGNFRHRKTAKTHVFFELLWNHRMILGVWPWQRSEKHKTFCHHEWQLQLKTNKLSAWKLETSCFLKLILLSLLKQGHVSKTIHVHSNAFCVTTKGKRLRSGSKLGRRKLSFSSSYHVISLGEPKAQHAIFEHLLVS